MLVSFSVANYRSFGDEVTLNMRASNRISDHLNHLVPIPKTSQNLLRTSVIYGANAAGKSNLVRAMRHAQNLLLGSIDTRSKVESFRFCKNSSEPTSFEFRFLLDKTIFIYGFDVAQGRFISEWLSIAVDNDELVVFERNELGHTEINEGAKKHFPDKEEMYLALSVLKRLPLRENQLFLNRVRSLPESAQGKTLGAIVRWLTADLVILTPEHRTCDILEQLDSDGTFQEFCSRFLGNVGTGIEGLRVTELARPATEWERNYLGEFDGSLREMLGCQADMDVRPKPDDPSKVIVRRLLAEHVVGSSRYSLPFGEESEGTQQILHLLPFLSAEEGQSKTVVIDELDRSLHPLVCWEFIRFFSETCPGARRQLIVTTHEAHLLNQELLRRDEYWFVEKDENQQSKLVSLSDFKIRNDLQIQKGYLQGRFGAIPMIGGMHELERLLECSPGGQDAEKEALA